MGEPVALAGSAQFPNTRWTLIRSARQSPQARRAALEELLAIYWKPLYCFARYKGLNADDAQDAVQGFLAHLLERNFLDQLDPSKGRFRAYLRTALNHYLVNQHEHDHAQKRGGDAVIVPLEFDVAERAVDAASTNPDAAYEREWAVTVMERALEALRGEFATGQRRGPFDLVLRFFQPAAAPSYADAATQYGMSIPQLKAFLHRARTRFRELARQEVAHTVADVGEVDAEIGELMRALTA